MIAPLLLSFAACALPQAPSNAPVPAAISVQDQSAQDQSAAPPARHLDAFPLKTIDLGAMGGYAVGKVWDAERTSTSFAQALLRFGVHFGPTFEGAMRGNFGIVVEGVGIWVDQEPKASGGGVNLLLRYTWAADRLRPFFIGGAGIIFSNEPIPPGETTRNFTPQAGLGLQYLFTDSLALDLEYRFHHLSNKGETATNPGVNSHLILFGFSWYR